MNPKRICLFGEVLFDVFPDGSHILGGAPFNVAWHLQAFAQNPYFISRIGDDAFGERISSAMQAWQMDIGGLQKDSNHPSGVVQVSVNHGEASYHILPNQAYDFIDAKQINLKVTNGMFYHGTLASRHEVSRAALLALKAQYQGKCFVDVNLRNPWWQKGQVLELLSHACWVKMNAEEFTLLAGHEAEDVQALRQFMCQYHIQNLLVTLGGRGAWAVNKDGRLATVSPAQAIPVVDTVGAGDGFAAVVLLGSQLGWPLSVIMERAQAFASALVGQRGATVQDRQFYQAFKEAWF